MVSEDEERFQRAVGRMSKVGIGCALWGLPVVILAVWAVPSWVGLGYIVLSAVVFAVIVIRHRARP